MLIHSASQLLTLYGGTQRGKKLGELGIISNGALLFRGEKIQAVGTTKELLSAFPKEELFDARGCVVMPGFVDAHTHLVWAGDRAAEFKMRQKGKSYMEILAAGGGILSTVRTTRIAEPTELKAQTRQRAREIFRYGTTTAEAKSGYGLQLSTELRLLEVLVQLDAEMPLQIVPTFLGAHTIPEEFKENPQAYTDLVCEQMLPAVKDWWQSHVPNLVLPFVDVFCEQGVFNLSQSRQILAKAKKLGFPLKIHADEFENLGGAKLAAELGAVSADHLVKTSNSDILALAASDTVAVGLPCTPFGLGEKDYTPAKKILSAEGLLALGSDLNPGTAWCGNMQFVIALACRTMGLTTAQAIAASTINAAAAISLQDQIGSLEKGKQADLLILNVGDYRNLGYRFGMNLVRAVIKKGKLYDFK